VPTWYDPAYRLPLPAIEARAGFEVRRADLVVWHLQEIGALTAHDLRTPPRVRYAELIAVHDPELVEALTDAPKLASVFGLAPEEVPVDALLRTLRLAVGGTVAAARQAARMGGPTLNLLGGFHHAGRSRAGGFSPLNDIAVAVGALRADGWTGEVAILDLDAHPPDGTADLLAGKAWIGSISGSDWGPLPGVDETLLPGADDAAYLAALGALLRRMPPAPLTFVIAGGDVLAGDRNGLLRLTLDGARRRELMVVDALAGRASVWLPGGGYHPDAWKVLAGVGLALAFHDAHPVAADADPLRSRFARVSATLPDTSTELDFSDIEEDLGLRRAGAGRFLGHYTADAVELALERFGVLEAVERLGYSDLEVLLDSTDVGDRFRLQGRAHGARHLLAETVVARSRAEGRPILFVHWMTLRHPRAAFKAGRRALPGQEVPGLGLARESVELLHRIAERLHLDGVALRPAWFHVARAAAPRFRFEDPARQGRFEALCDAVAGLEPGHAARAVAEGRVRLDGAVYTWEPDLMISWSDGHRPDPVEVARARAAARFAVVG